MAFYISKQYFCQVVRQSSFRYGTLTLIFMSISRFEPLDSPSQRTSRLSLRWALEATYSLTRKSPDMEIARGSGSNPAVLILKSFIFMTRKKCAIVSTGVSHHSGAQDFIIGKLISQLRTTSAICLRRPRGLVEYREKILPINPNIIFIISKQYYKVSDFEAITECTEIISTFIKRVTLKERKKLV